MTRQQFLTQLATAHKEHPEYKPVIYNGCCFRLDGPDGTFCPITFLYFYKHGEIVSVNETDSAALNMGLSPEAIYEIVGASDQWSEFLWANETQKRLSRIFGMEND